jgi:hypothetical protein
MLIAYHSRLTQAYNISSKIIHNKIENQFFPNSSALTMKSNGKKDKYSCKNKIVKMFMIDNLNDYHG